MKIKTENLTGAQLDWAVAKAEGRTLVHNPMGPQSGHGWWIWEETPSDLGRIMPIYLPVGPRTSPKTRTSGDRYSPSTDWAQGGPIIEREKIGIGHAWVGTYWLASMHNVEAPVLHGPTHLIAAMRCYCHSKLGDEVEVPDGLV